MVRIYIMRIFACLLTLIIFASILPLPTQAQENADPYQDYLFNFSRYQTESDKLSTAKAAYKKDAALQNLTNLIETTKTTLLTIGDTMIAYNYFLQSEIAGNGLIPPETLDFFNRTLKESNDWYLAQKPIINSATNLESMITITSNYQKEEALAKIKSNQLRIIANSARIAKYQDNAKILLAKLFTYINNNSAIADPRQEVWRGQILALVTDTNNLINQNFQTVPLVTKIVSGDTNNSKIKKNSQQAIENIANTAKYLNEINNTL